MGFITKKRRRSVSGKRPLSDLKTAQHQLTQKRRFLLAGLLITLGIAAAWQTRAGGKESSTTVPVASNSTEAVPVRSARFISNPASQRPNFKYSIIPGGAYSIDELNAALSSDRVADAHYAVFNRAKLQMTKLGAPKLMYASFRKGDDVYWTSHPIRISADEALITDGNNLARARCGNRLSEKPKSPTTRSLSSERELDDIDAQPKELKTAMLGDGREPAASALQYEVFPPEIAVDSSSALPTAGNDSPNYLSSPFGFSQSRYLTPPAGVETSIQTANGLAQSPPQGLGDTLPPPPYALDLPTLMSNPSGPFNNFPVNIAKPSSTPPTLGQSTPPGTIAIAELWKTPSGSSANIPPPPAIGEFTLSPDSTPGSGSDSGGPGLFSTNAATSPENPPNSPAQTPEPATGLLFVCAGGLVWVLRRWRIRHSSN